METLQEVTSIFTTLVKEAADSVRSEMSVRRNELLRSYSAAFEYAPTVAERLPKQHAHQYSKFKKSLTVVNNVLGGVLDGLENDDLTLSELRSISKDLTSHLNVLSVDFKVAQEKIKSKVRVVVAEDIPITAPPRPRSKFQDIEDKLTIELNKKPNTMSFKEGLSEIAEKLKDSTSNEVQDLNLSTLSEEAAKTRIAYLKGEKAKLPLSAGKSGFTLVKSSVLPIFTAVDKSGGVRALALGPNIKAQPNPTYLLKSVGIRSLPINEYVVIENQILLIIDKNVLPSKTLKSITKTNKIKEKIIPMTTLEYANEILSTLDNKYSLVNETPTNNPRNSDLLMYWVMPSNVLSILIRKGFPKIHKWGLPF